MRWVVLLLLAVIVSGCLAPQRHLDGTEYVRSDYHARLHWPEPYPEVLWILHAAPGQQPHPDILPDIHREMSLALDKPVTLLVEPLDVPAREAWSLTNLYALAADLHEENVRDGRIILHTALLPGCVEYSDERGCIAGVEVDDVGFVFLDGFRVGNAADGVHDPLGAGSPAGERYIILHETGHAIGLVGVPLPTLHPERVTDEPCRCHSRNPGSVMGGQGLVLGSLEHGHYVELANRVLDGRVKNYRFDADDLDDLRLYQELGRRLQAEA